VTDVLPAPHLDDRTFQQLVDEAKRHVQQRCPTWTDHNVSDPGVTLLEAVAQMVDTLIYRLNRVPDRNYVKFLEMIGVELRPPAAARGAVTFWLSAPQPQPVLVRAETEVATARTDIHAPVVFTTLTELSIVPCTFSRCATQAASGDPVDTTGRLGAKGFPCFADVPAPGDSLLVGLSDAVPSCAVLLRMDCSVSGIGVDPRRPPLVWEAWTGHGWAQCDVDRDGTGGFNQPGDVVLHVPATHRTSIVARQRAGWLRCRLLETGPDEPTYTAPPRVSAITAHTVGGTAPIIHAEVVRGEDLGHSDGTPGQRMPLQRRPVVSSDDPLTVEVETEGETLTWEQVPHFAESGPADRHFRLDSFAGEVQFGPATRLPGGGLVHHGAVPVLGSRVRITAYRTGGGRDGNVAAGQVQVLKTSVPYVATVTNRAPAVGGAEAESLDDAKVRGPLLLRSRGRAVTAADIEELTRDVAPEAARVHCVPATEAADAGGIRVLVVPHVAGDALGRLRRADLDPAPEVLQRIAEALDERRLVGSRLLVAPPEYAWLTAVVSVGARPRFDPDEVRDEVLATLFRLFHPLLGGNDGTGWPFGRSVQPHEVVAALARVPGVDLAQEVEVKLYPAEPPREAIEQTKARRLPQVQRLDLADTALLFSYEHQVQVR
jgi:predicted phage baseplate assembly protein